MQLTEKERDLLVDTLIESLWQFPLEGTHRSVREMIVHKAIMPTVEGVLADRAVPEPDAVHAVHEALVNNAPDWIIDREDGELLEMARAALQAAAVEPEPEPGLDEMLDSVHPEARVSLYYVSMPMVDDPDPYWIAQVRVPVTGFVGNRMCEGTGPTRMEAIQSAVRKAKESGDV